MAPPRKKKHPMTIEEIERRMDRAATGNARGEDGEIPIPEHADDSVGRRGHLEAHEVGDLFGFGSSFRMEDYE